MAGEQLEERKGGGGRQGMSSNLAWPPAGVATVVADFGVNRRVGPQFCAMGCCSSKPDIGGGSGSDSNLATALESSKSGVSGRRVSYQAPETIGGKEIMSGSPFSTKQIGLYSNHGIKPAGAARRLLPAPTRTRVPG